MDATVPTAYGVLAHVGQPVAPHDLLTAWSADPAVVLLLVAGSAVYALGARRLRHHATAASVLPAWRVRCFVGAVAVAAVALLSPLEALAGTLFSAHMGQHLLLTLALPPLLVLSRPVLVGGMALSRRSRHTLATVRAVVRPGWRAAAWAGVAVLAHMATLWIWHVPTLYVAAIRDDLVHVVEHVTLVAGALPFWWLVADARGRLANAAGVLGVFGGTLLSAGLAGLITFSAEAWYPAHAAGAFAWGLTALEDQQVAGGLMWFPGSVAYILGGCVVFWRWLRRDEVALAAGWLRELGGGSR